MVKQLSLTLAADFPEISELQNLLSLAKITWKLYGISAGDLSKMDDWTFEVLRILLAK